MQEYIANFEWQPGVTPLSTPRAVALGVTAYLATVFGIKAVVKRRVELPGWVAALHNLNLCVGSLIMFLGCAWESIQLARQEGSVRWMVCLPVGTPAKGPLFFWSYVYYLSKYYEFLDTVLLALKAKPLSFLHVSHHALVCPMAFMWLACSQSLQQVGLLFNTGIHVVMYYYYFSCCLGVYPAWKRFITTGQIVQFVFSFAVSVPFWYITATSPFPAAATCSGYWAMVFNAAFNAMLLLLFVSFHRATYSTRKDKGA